MKATAQFKKYKLVKKIGNLRGLRFAHAMRVPKKYILAMI